MEQVSRARVSPYPSADPRPVVKEQTDAYLARGIGGGNTAPIDELRRSCPGMYDVPTISTDDVVGADLRLIVATSHQRS